MPLPGRVPAGERLQQTVRGWSPCTLPVHRLFSYLLPTSRQVERQLFAVAAAAPAQRVSLVAGAAVYQLYITCSSTSHPLAESSAVSDGVGAIANEQSPCMILASDGIGWRVADGPKRRLGGKGVGSRARRTRAVRRRGRGGFLRERGQ
jgi:hypothetical protein